MSILEQIDQGQAVAVRWTPASRAEITALPNDLRVWVDARQGACEWDGPIDKDDYLAWLQTKPGLAASIPFMKGMAIVACRRIERAEWIAELVNAAEAPRESLMLPAGTRKTDGLAVPIRRMGFTADIWGRTKVSGGRWYWVVGRRWATEGILGDGFAPTEREATNAAWAFIRENVPERVVFSGITGQARDCHKEYYGRHGRTKFKCSNLDGRKLVWSTIWSCSDRWYAPHLIMGVTDRYVYVSRQSVDITDLGTERYERDGFVRLDRKKLEAGETCIVGCYSYELEPRRKSDGWAWRQSDATQSSNEGDEETTLKSLRKTMQENHPDKGGDPDKFMAARDLYEMIKRRRKALAAA